MIRPTFAIGPKVFFVGFLTVAVAACGGPSAQEPYAVRIGSDFLYESELERALAGVDGDAGRESARQQFIDQWITTTLLAQEARSNRMSEEAAVRARLAESERAVLASLLVERLYAESVPEPTTDELLRYYETARESLVTREDYLRVRYLRSSNPDSAAAARRLLQRAMRGGGVDSLWTIIARRYAVEPDESIAAAATYTPRSQLFVDLPAVASAVQTLGSGQIASVIEEDAGWHVVQLVDVAAAGTTPEASWIRPELKRRVELQKRKEAYARLVQRLRTEAEGRDAILFGQ